MAAKGKFYKVPDSRKALIDLLEEGAGSHFTPTFLEIDVTEALVKIKQVRRTKKIKISFLSWVLSCIGLAIEKHPYVHACKHKKGVMVFDAIDISLVVERDNPSPDPFYSKIMMPYIIRDVNSKTLEDISEEIRLARVEKINPGDTNLGDTKNTSNSRLFVKLPKFLRQIVFWKRIRNNAYMAKATMGTVMVSPIHMILNRKDYFWGISRSSHPLSILINSLLKRPEFIDGKITNRDKLCLTIGFKHDLIDGAPYIRFVETLRKIMEAGTGLNID